MKEKPMTLPSRKTLGIACAAVLLVLLAGGAILAAEETTVTRSFQVKPGGKFVLDTDIGSVEVRGSTAETVGIAVYREVRSGDPDRVLKDFKLDFEQRGNDVYVTGEYDRSGFRRFWDSLRNRLRVRFVVIVPTPYGLDLKTSGGGISAAELEGFVMAKTSGGGLEFDRIKGDVRGTTSGGGIRIGRVDGDVDVHTSGGDVRIEETTGRVLAGTSGGGIRIERAGGEVEAHTSGGGIIADDVRGALRASTSGGSVTATISSQPKSRCSLTTSGGSVNVYLAEGVGVDVDAHASGGSVSTDFPVTLQGRIERHSLRAQINGGGPELYLRTSGGGVRIKKR
jgi:DUF4097 and DUF4098 domain-containing protein YvlB